MEKVVDPGDGMPPLHMLEDGRLEDIEATHVELERLLRLQKDLKASIKLCRAHAKRLSKEYIDGMISRSSKKDSLLIGDALKVRSSKKDSLLIGGDGLNNAKVSGGR